MSDLDEALRLACRARDSWRTLQGTAIAWTHLARSKEASRRASEAQGASTSQVVLYSTGSGESEPAPEEHESVSRLWIELPSRGRSETRTKGGPGEADDESTVVVDGGTFWMDHPATGPVTNNGDPSHQAGLGIDLSLLDPAPLIAGSLVTRIGETTIAGRPGMLFRLDPVPPSLVTQDHLRLEWIACPRELVLDAERGTALSDTAFLDGEPSTGSPSPRSHST